MTTPPWQTLVSSCDGATEVVIAAPYIKHDALARMLGHVDPQASLTCVTRWTPLDIQTGVSDIDCRTLVIDRGGSFQLHNRLHAKYYRFDDRVLIGSANLTSAGLSYGGLGNFEVLCEPGPPFHSTVFEAELRRGSREVTDREFEIWQECPVLERLTSSDEPEAIGSSLDDWKPQTRNPEYLWLAYDGNKSLIISEEQRALAESDLTILELPGALTRQAFTAWIRSSLQASPFVESVRALSNQQEPLMWDTIATEWKCSRQVAARWLSTTQNWLRYFTEP